MGIHSQVALKFSHFTRLVVYLTCSKKTSCNGWPFCFIFYYNLDFININITIVIFIHLLYNTNKCGYNLVARISCFRPDCASSILATRSILSYKNSIHFASYQIFFHNPLCLDMPYKPVNCFFLSILLSHTHQSKSDCFHLFVLH